MQYHPFSNRDWENLQTATQAAYRKALGARPTFKSVARSLPNRYAVTALEYAAMLVLLVLTAFTSYKVGALAMPFADNMLTVLLHETDLTPAIQSSFRAITALLFMMLATPSLIYFKLLDNEPEIVAEKQATANMRWYRRLSLDWISPRLPFAIVYISAAWLFYVSSFGTGSIFEKYLPVLVEVGLAQLVGNILKKRADYRKLVWDAYDDRVATWDSRIANADKDPLYLKLLYTRMKEGLVNLQHQGRKPNVGLQQADAATIDTILVTEYRRLTGGDHFAEAIGAPVQTGKRIPPNGKAWTPTTLLHDLRIRGVGSNYSERQLQQDYAEGYGARAAWRAGARTSITQ